MFNVISNAPPSDDYVEYNLKFKLHPIIGTKASNYKTNILIIVSAVNS